MKTSQPMFAIVTFASLLCASGAWAQEPVETTHAEREVTRTVEQNEDGTSTVQRQGNVTTRNAEELSRSRTNDLAHDDEGNLSLERQSEALGRDGRSIASSAR